MDARTDASPESEAGSVVGSDMAAIFRFASRLLASSGPGTLLPLLIKIVVGTDTIIAFDRSSRELAVEDTRHGVGVYRVDDVNVRDCIAWDRTVRV